MRIKIKDKLRVICICYIALIALTVVTNFRTYKEINGDSSFINYFGKMRAYNYRMAQLSYNVIFKLDDGESAEAIEVKIKEIDDMFENLVNGNNELDIKPIDNDDIKANLDSIKIQWEKEIKPAYINILKNEDRLSWKFIKDNVNGYVKSIDNVIGDYTVYSKGKITSSKNKSISMLIISIILSIVFGTVMIKIIMKPLIKIKDEFEGISKGEGDLRKEILYKYNDEIGELTKHFNGFIGKIREIIGTMFNSSKALKESVASMKVINDELGRATETISVSMQNVSSGSVEQSNMIQCIMSQSENVDTEINEVMTKIDILLTQLENSKNSSMEGKNILNKEIEELKGLVSNTKELSNTINELEKDSQSIQGILSIINQISSQTNLLALNAAIEASRVGEHGKGFSVIAEEIRKLSDESRESTEKIEDIVKYIIERIFNIGKYMSTILDKITIYHEDMTNVEMKFNEVTNEANEAYLEIKDIREINHNVKEEFKELNSYVKKVAHIAEENSVNSQEIAASIEEQAASFEEVNNNMNLINQLSIDLNQVIEKFKI
ncbi:methyl-accepting chemotaxis protein [uncultured Clostridium sp.]|uniref:methyl-accepting chemotaxis protein n=1 Tax=uncultured Clostridium sp. TaxID=59620 RepID=UPI00258EB48A|nr:methyl-accepting chemotaxis protein [uncultured Clostridium sp.]MDU1350700.1 methyl-accepting chemotaxis protein [Clostridium argentinense]